MTGRRSGVAWRRTGVCAVLALVLPWLSPARAAVPAPVGAPSIEFEAPRVRSLLEHAWAAESGEGQVRNRRMAAHLYCEAARLGSAEGHYRAGRLYATGGLVNAAKAHTFFATAVQFGNERALVDLEALRARRGELRPLDPECLTEDPYDEPPILAERPEELGEMVAYEPEPEPEEKVAVFDLEAYLKSFKAERARIATLVAQHAPSFGVDARLALAIASVESNFDPMATSPRNAQGVMQLIPDTAKRFNVKNSYDPADNIRGGLAYLRWLTGYFAGDLIRVVAAYNAGEGAVDRHKGVPPYAETRMYVRRVLDLAGLSNLLQPTASARQ